MKKLIAISVMLVLLTGAAFAQISGDLNLGVTLIHSQSYENAPSTATDIYIGGRGADFGHENGAKWSLTFGEGTGSGRIVYRLHDNTFWGWFQWTPIEQLRIRFGWDRDGIWGAAQINGWGFTGVAKDLVAVRDYNGGLFMAARDAAFYGGLGDGIANVLAVSILPMDGLQINLGLPSIAAGNWGGGLGTKQEMSIALSTFHLNVVYNIEDVGVTRLSFVGLGGLGKDKEKTASVGRVFGSFYLTAIQGMAIDIGVRYDLPWQNAANQDNGGQLAVGFGFNMPQVVENLSFKLRAGATLSGKTNGADNATTISLGILPMYNFGSFRFYFHAGLGMSMPNQGDTSMDWFVNPYIQIPAGGFNFWIGLQIEEKDTGAKDGIAWGIPIGFNVNY